MRTERSTSLVGGSAWDRWSPFRRWATAILFAVYLIGGSVCFVIAVR